MDHLPTEPGSQLVPPAILQPARPRIWTIFATLAAALVMTLILQGVGMVAWIIAKGVSAQQFDAQLADLLETPSGFMLLMGLGQAALGVTVIAAGILSPEPFLSRLGFVKTNLSRGMYVAMVVGSVIPLGIGVAIGQALSAMAIAKPGELDLLADKLYDQMTPGLAVGFVALIAFVPAFVEESLFRGYIQRRLLARWPAALVLTGVAILFAAVHGTVYWAIQVLPLGLWLGVLAWRTGSIWPGIWSHAFINGARNIWGIVAELAGISDQAQIVGLVILGLLALFAFIVAVRGLAQSQAVPSSLQLAADPQQL
jgi:membrane protease YdiL (CAAX protease family)